MLSQKRWLSQSTVSFLILSLLCCIAFSILWIHAQRQSVAVPGGIATDVTDTQTVAVVGELFPGFVPSLPEGFTVAGKPEHYNSETLYEKINGKAPLYLDAGFVSLTTQRFVSSSDSSLWFEAFVYDMGSPQGAFSVFGAQRRADSATSSELTGSDHYLTENGVFLHHGPYYVECVGSAASDILLQAMTELAGQCIVVDLGGEKKSGEPGLSLFPQENIRPDSFTLILQDAFGAQMLTDIYVAKYDIQGSELTAFFSKRESPEQAGHIAQNYFQLLLDGGGRNVEGEEKFLVVELYGLFEVVFSVGPFVAGTHEAEDGDLALDLAEKLHTSLLNTDKQ